MKNDSKLETLTQAYLDGSLTEANAERLNAILAEDREARFVFAETLNLDSAIAATAAGWESESESEFPRRNRKWGGWPSLAACALILIAGSWLWHGASQPGEVREYATVERGVGVESLPAGMKLHGGMHTITAGTVELLTALGVQIIIEAPAEFRFESSQRLHMMRGRLAAEVPPAAKGFTVITPTGDAVDLGTRFGVDVPE
ncbi:MAG: ferric-dicitrate binding protein FerR (iron transport regulator), partial [Akkermansiaceae bacterium]